MALNVPGPLAAARLRDAGAHVSKIEPPQGDPLASYAPGWYRELHDGISIERIDLKAEPGRTRARELLADADLFLASQRPSALARLGVDAATLLDARSPGSSPLFPRLRWLNIVGDAARPEEPGHDLTYLARAGLLGREMPRSVFADVVSAEHAFAVALLLLRQPPGARAQIGISDALAPLVAARRHGLTGPGTLLGGGLAAYGIYAARIGHVAIAALEPRFRQRLYELLGLEIDADLSEAMRARTAEEWERWADEHDLPIARVR
jgi:crotonobetainyl-CoA:carnitine CoA-transferase CaiB-like acyl-CoA transferase